MILKYLLGKQTPEDIVVLIYSQMEALLLLSMFYTVKMIEVMFIKLRHCFMRLIMQWDTIDRLIFAQWTMEAFAG